MHVNARQVLRSDLFGRPEVLSEDVLHHRGRHRPRFLQGLPDEVAHQLAELVRGRTLDGVVSRIVGPRSHLVEIDLTVPDEILDGQNPPVAAVAHEAFALGFHPFQHLRIGLGGHDAEVEDSVAMDVAPHRKAHHPFGVGDHHDAGLEVETHELLQDAGHRQQRQGPFDVGLGLQHQLSVSVVPQRAGFPARRAVPVPSRRPAATLRRPRRRNRACEARGRGRWSSRAGGPANRTGVCNPAGYCISRTAGSESLPARFRIRRSPRRCGGTAPRAPRHRRRPPQYDRRRP